MKRTALVYGTLRPGNGERVTVSGFKMFNIGWFPGIVRGDGEIVCERVEVKDDEHLASLDRYEGYSEENPESSLYTRQLHGDDFIYVYNCSVNEDTEVEGGDWLEFTGETRGRNAHLATLELNQGVGG
ncbi:MAG: hypothetical protein Unbinned2691contig1000_47 [Prokaryotic dsDNA virus sp.]|nr:MAG: hypothetical protein Unbinned2691contig1000_47 [Prokaryotic dsDNA virus sp.]|tara:strand:- start:8640 stop:9023 length:384 start_codon:yes stop_codon:yes gene_type:complete